MLVERLFAHETARVQSDNKVITIIGYKFVDLVQARAYSEKKVFE